MDPDLQLFKIERFSVLERLGAGAFGIVYKAFDHERHSVVALKVLRQKDAAALYRFKREFRSLSDLTHPNLVTLYELMSDGEQWFFAMELIEGVDFLAYVSSGFKAMQDDALLESTPTLARVEMLDTAATRQVGKRMSPATQPKLTPARLSRLNTALRQLAEGIHALHQKGILHRDIKPSNVLVTREERVVLFDFGLVTELAPSTVTLTAQLVGTPDYMSPEQAAEQPVSEASDWYSVGVILYKSLTGRAPFSGSLLKVLQDKQNCEPPPPSKFAVGVPSDLDVLCQDLLRRNPDERPTGKDVLSRLGLDKARTDAWLETYATRKTPFIGRERYLSLLRRAFTDIKGGDPISVHIVGAAGMGKTAMVRTFLEGVQSTDQDVVVLSGRCYERESVPYKAMDSLVDNLALHLAKLPIELTRDIVPPDIGVLSRVFPVLFDIGAAHVHIQREHESMDPRAIRSRVFAALKQLLTRIAQRWPLILHIDDLQWGDEDSAEFLADLLHPPSAPLLIILAYRPEAEKHRIPQILRESRYATVDIRTLTLEPLNADVCREIAESLLDGLDQPKAPQATSIAGESEGNPLFVEELVRFAKSVGVSESPRHEIREVTLEDVFMSRVETLPPPARSLLEIIAVSGRPIDRTLALKAAGLEQEYHDVLMPLRLGHFIQGRREGEQEIVETFHDRLRETVVGNLQPKRLRAVHKDIAYVLENSGRPNEVDALAYHYLAADDELKAMEYSLLAARRARDLYAHHKAIRHYDTVVRMASESRLDTGHQLHLIKQEMAATLRQAGEYDRAIQLLRACLPFEAEESHRIEIHIGLGKLYQEKGSPTSAIRELETALKLLGMKAPKKKASTIMRVLIQLVSHYLQPLIPRLKESSSREHLNQTRLGILFTLMRIYYFTDIFMLLWAGTHAMNLSIHLRRDADLSVAYGNYGALLCGTGLLETSARYCEKSVALARRSNDRVAEGLALARLGTCAVFANNLKQAEGVLQESVEIFKEVGEMWELQTSLMMLATCHFLSSDFGNAETMYEDMGQLARRLKAVMHQAWALSWVPFCHYLIGHAPAAQVRTELTKAIDLSAQVEDFANQSAARMHAANVAVREHNVNDAAVLAVETFEGISRYRVRVPFLQIAFVDAAEAALFALEHNATNVPVRSLLKVARDGYRKALRLGRSCPYLRGPGLRIKARYTAFTKGSDAAEPLFRKAIGVLEKTPNRWETGVAYGDAALALPGLREKYRQRAMAIFQEIGTKRELVRVKNIPCA